MHFPGWLAPGLNTGDRRNPTGKLSAHTRLCCGARAAPHSLWLTVSCAVPCPAAPPSPCFLVIHKDARRPGTRGGRVPHEASHHYTLRGRTAWQSTAQHSTCHDDARNDTSKAAAKTAVCFCQHATALLRVLSHLLKGSSRAVFIARQVHAAQGVSAGGVQQHRCQPVCDASCAPEQGPPGGIALLLLLLLLLLPHSPHELHQLELLWHILARLQQEWGMQSGRGAAKAQPPLPTLQKRTSSAFTSCNWYRARPLNTQGDLP
jgi:hypothetical protein